MQCRRLRPTNYQEPSRGFSLAATAGKVGVHGDFLGRVGTSMSLSRWNDRDGDGGR